MKFTGERYIPNEFNEKENISEMHLNRYNFSLSFVKNKTVVDIACGEGYGSNLLAQNAKNVLGIDIDQNSIEHAKNKYKKDNLSFLIGSAEKIEASDNSIDVLVSFETIEHVKESVQKNFISEAHRILKPEGIFIVSTPDKDISGEGHNEFHIHELNKKEFLNMLQVHFKKIDLYGQNIKKYSNKLSLFVARILHSLVKLDKFKIRHKLFPQNFRQNINTAVSTSALTTKSVNNIFIPQKIENDETAEYLIAICHK